MRGLAALLVVLLAGSAGCALNQAQRARPAAAKPAAPPPSPPKKLKVAVLPAEKLLLPKVAEALNERLAKASVSDASESSTAPVSMETALLQMDCAQATDACYTQIAKQFAADRLLWAEIEREARSRKKKTPSTIIRVMMFDVQSSTVVGRTEQSFPGNVPDEALDQLVSGALAQASGRKVSP